MTPIILAVSATGLVFVTALLVRRGSWAKRPSRAIRR